MSNTQSPYTKSKQGSPYIKHGLNLKGNAQKVDEEQKSPTLQTQSLSVEDLVPIFDRLFFALEKRLDAYIEKRTLYKQIKRKLKDAKVQLEEEKMTADEFAALEMPNAWILP